MSHRKQAGLAASCGDDGQPLPAAALARFTLPSRASGFHASIELILVMAILTIMVSHDGADALPFLPRARAGF